MTKDQIVDSRKKKKNFLPSFSQVSRDQHWTVWKILLSQAVLPCFQVDLLQDRVIGEG